MSDTTDTHAAQNKSIVDDIIVRSAIKYLWCGCAEHCHCSHHLTFHSKNDEPEAGSWQAPGCPCIYFKPYRQAEDEEVQP